MGYNAMQALGSMAEGAGSFFGTMAVEKRRTEALAQARAQKLEDRAYDENKAKEDKEAAVLAADIQAEKDLAAERAKLDDAEIRATELRRLKREEDFAHKKRERKQERLEKELNPEPVAVGSGGPSKMNATTATMKLRLDAAKNAYASLDELMKDYDPTGLTGGWNQLMTKSEYTNWLATDEGQTYNAVAKRVKEQFLRAATGAAAPTSEQLAYAEMYIPRFGDGPETVAAKKAAMKSQIKIMYELYDDDPVTGAPDNTPIDVRMNQFLLRSEATIAEFNIKALEAADAKRREEAERVSKIKVKDAKGNNVLPHRRDRLGYAGPEGGEPEEALDAKFESRVSDLLQSLNIGGG